MCIDVGLKYCVQILMLINIKFRKFTFSPPKKKTFHKMQFKKKNVAIVCSRSSEEKGSGGNEIFSLAFL